MQLHFRLDRALGVALNAHCKAHGYSKGKLISKILRQHLANPPGEPAQEPAGGPIAEAEPLPQPGAFLGPLEVLEDRGEPRYRIDQIAGWLGLFTPDMTAEIDYEDLFGAYTNLTGLITALGVAKRQGKDVTQFEAMLRSMGIEP